MYRMFDYAITFSELPFSNNGSLTFYTGSSTGKCKYACNGCSWGENKPVGREISMEECNTIFKKKIKHTDCVTFLGEGEDIEGLIQVIKLAKEYKFKVCLYTGGELNDISESLKCLLDYIKVGKWTGKTLLEKDTNQHLYELKEGKIIKEYHFFELYNNKDQK